MKTRTDPKIIRTVLAHAATTTPYTAAKTSGYNHRTVYRWAALRATDPTWPTDADVAQWERETTELGDARVAKAAMKRDWTKRVYLARGPMRIDNTGTTRRLRALYALGWTSTDLAPRLGCSPARVGHLVAGISPQVHRHTAARVASIYDDLCMTVPQDPEVLAPKMIRVHDRQRRQSAAKGWAPPLAWDDIDTDPAPHEHPVTTAAADPVVVDRILAGDWALAATRDEKLAVLRRWRAAGHSDNALERRTGWNVSRDLSRRLHAEENAA